VIVQTSAGGIAHAGGMEPLGALVHALAKRAPVPVALHLDHGTDLALVRQAIVSGLYTSVMVDASHLPFAENIATTKAIVALAHKRHLFVEAELGPIPGAEDHLRVSDRQATLTNPSLVRRFIRETGCDALAISIGTRHGFAKFLERPSLDFARLKAIAAHSCIPLVLHGASALPARTRTHAQALGLAPKEGRGVADRLVRKAVRLGISKVNVDSDLRLVFTTALAASLHRHPHDMDPRSYLGEARNALQHFIEEKIHLLGSQNKVEY
jgi:fructose-bisphosphate aldolase class II